MSTEKVKPSDQSDSESESIDSVESIDSCSDDDEMVTTIWTPQILKNTLTLPLNTSITLILSDDEIVTEYKYIQYFNAITSRIVDESDESDTESDLENEIIIDARFISKDIYMKYSAELYNLSDHLIKIYVDHNSECISKSYNVSVDMTKNSIPEYCQNWIKSKKIIDLDVYIQSSSDDTNLTRLFGCESIKHLINYWCVYLSINKDIALLYCDEDSYKELLMQCNLAVGVYNPLKFKNEH